MSRDLDELLEKMKRQDVSTVSVGEVQQLINEKQHQQAAGEYFKHQILAQQNAQQNAEKANWPNLNSLGKGKMKTFTVRFNNGGDDTDEDEIEATRYNVDGSMVVFYGDNNNRVFTLPVSKLIFIKEDEE